MADGAHKDGIVAVVLGHGDLEPLVVLGLVGHHQGIGQGAAGQGVLGGGIAVLAGLQQQGDIPDGAVEQGDHHAVANARLAGAVQGRQHTGGQVHTHLMVAEAGDGQHGQGVLIEQSAQDTAAGKESGEVEAGQVLVGALLAVAGHEGIHQLGVLGVERLIVQTGLFQRVLPPVGDEDIRLGDELLQRLTAGGGLGVQADAGLAGVLQIIGGVLLLVLGTALVDSGVAQGVAGGGFDLDDLGAQIRQKAGAAGGGDKGGQLQHLYALEGTLYFTHIVPPCMLINGVLLTFSAGRGRSRGWFAPAQTAPSDGPPPPASGAGRRPRRPS